MSIVTVRKRCFFDLLLFERGSSSVLKNGPTDTCLACLREVRSFVSRDSKNKLQPNHSSDCSVNYAAFSGMGISRGLKTVRWTVFLTAFRFPYGKKDTHH